MSLEWVSIPAGIVAGALSGFGSAWIGRPAAAAAAETAKEEAQARTQRRRELVDGGRNLVVEARRFNWPPWEVSEDPRLTQLWRHLSPDVQATYSGQDKPAPNTMIVTRRGFPPPQHDHDRLADEVNRLEAEWDLS